MRTRFDVPVARPLALLAAALLALAAGFWPATALAHNDTPGNNGTVKIHLGDTEKEPGEVRNEPHVCTFHLHFYFADPEQAGSWQIEEWAPTGDKGTVAMDGTYDTHGDGEDRQPEQGVYELPDGHYKLFWDGDLDTQKHDKMKVFWVDCGTSQPTSAPSETSGAPSPTGSVAPTDTTGPTTPPSETPSGSELPATGSGSPSETPSGSELPAVGSGSPASSPTGAALGAVGTPAVTPPATDGIGTATPASDSGWRLTLVVIAALVAAFATVARMPMRQTSKRRRERR